MNRPIKFMAWNRRKKRWCKDDFCVSEEGDILLWDVDYEPPDGVGDYKGECEFNLYQFTGLLDKDGKEIYCGHIFGKGIFNEGYIEWCDKCKQLTLQFNDGEIVCMNCEGDITYNEIVEEVSKMRISGHIAERSLTLSDTNTSSNEVSTEEET